MRVNRFCRRLATALRRQRLAGAPGPLAYTAVVKELKIPDTHWYLWSTQGTRITANACHWLDLACHLSASEPRELTLLNAADTTSLALRFSDGSLATIV